MPRGFTHEDGWFDILWRLCVDLEPLVTELERAGGPKFEVLQVKEKFGGDGSVCRTNPGAATEVFKSCAPAA